MTIQKIVSVIFLVGFITASSASYGQNQTFTFENTTIQINLPVGFEVSTEASLVNQESGTEFIGTELPIPFELAVLELTPESFAENGAEVSEGELFQVDGLNGTLITSTLNNDDKVMNKSILIFGNTTTTYMIMAVYGNEISMDEIESLLNTVKI